MICNLNGKTEFIKIELSSLKTMNYKCANGSPYEENQILHVFVWDGIHFPADSSQPTILAVSQNCTFLVIITVLLLSFIHIYSPFIQNFVTE